MMLGSPTLWATLGSWIQQGFSLVTMIVVARLLDPAAFGLLNIALVFVLLAQRVLLESVGYAVQRYGENQRSALDSAFLLAVVAGTVMAALFFGFSGLLSRLFGEPELAPVLQVMALMPLLDALSTVHLGLLRRDLEYRSLAMRTLWSNLTAGVIGIALALAGFGVWSLVAQQLIASAGGLAAAWWAHPWRPGRRWLWADIKALVVFGAPMIGSSVVFVLSNRLDVMALAGASSAALTGAYSLAKRLVRAVTDLIVSGAMSVTLSTMSAPGSDIQRHEQMACSKLRLVAFIAYPLYAGLGALAPELIDALLGPKWSASVVPLQILAVFGIVQVPQMVAVNLLVSRGRTQELLAFNVTTLCMLAGLIAVLVSHGAAGVAAAFVLQAIFGLPVLLVLVLWRTRVNGLRLLRSVLPALALSTVMAGAMLLAGALLAQQSPWHRLMVGVAVGALVYAGLSRLLLKAQVGEIVRMIRSKVGSTAT